MALLRKFLVFSLLFLLLFIGAERAFAVPRWCQPSDQQTDDATIHTGYCWFFGIVVITDGSNAVTVDIYDNTAASGTKLIPTWVVTTSSTDRWQKLEPPAPVRCENGIHVDVTISSGTVEYMVYYNK